MGVKFWKPLNEGRGKGKAGNPYLVVGSQLKSRRRAAQANETPELQGDLSWQLSTYLFVLSKGLSTSERSLKSSDKANRAGIFGKNCRLCIICKRKRARRYKDPAVLPWNLMPQLPATPSMPSHHKRNLFHG